MAAAEGSPVRRPRVELVIDMYRREPAGRHPQPAHEDMQQHHRIDAAAETDHQF